MEGVLESNLTILSFENAFVTDGYTVAIISKSGSDTTWSHPVSVSCLGGIFKHSLILFQKTTRLIKATDRGGCCKVRIRRSSVSVGLPFNQNPAHIKENNLGGGVLLAGKITFLNLFYINQSPGYLLKLNRAWKSLQSLHTFLPAQDLKKCILFKV